MKFVARKLLTLVFGVVVVFVFTCALIIDWLDIPEPKWWDGFARRVDKLFDKVMDLRDKLAG